MKAAAARKIDEELGEDTDAKFSIFIPLNIVVGIAKADAV